MDELITLRNVIDIRTNQFHSIAVVKEQNAKYFIKAFEEPVVEEMATENIIEEVSETPIEDTSETSVNEVSEESAEVPDSIDNNPIIEETPVETVDDESVDDEISEILDEDRPIINFDDYDDED